ncbi:MAG: type I-F CRISPR-associated endonuclease Cas1 [Proteobacteria bacterium]|nr:type I-F CRISPR-associated endonuclease Cas1 [Pseudomonadota bacterium]
MNLFNSSDLKTILHSKRANIFYLEECRVLVKGGRVVYLTEEKKQNAYYNIPIANTTVILLGIGTSITQSAVRMLASASVLIGFSGNGGTPLIAGNEVEWLSPQSEYRPTEYMQGWMKFWFDENKRLEVAKFFQKSRINFLKNVWHKDRDLRQEGFYLDDFGINSALKTFAQEIDSSQKSSDLSQKEALLTKQLYKTATKITKIENFTREREATDLANTFLNHGNYLAYGLAATTLWVLGISHSFAVMHGKTRRGALVFDLADLIKDAIVLPWSFICAKEKASEQEFRSQILQKFTEHQALDFMFDQVKEAALQTSQI